MNQAIIDAKKAVVTEVAEKMKSAKSTVIVEYRGLTVAEVTELRNSLREENVELKVYKNKLVQRATTAEGYEALNEDLVGPNALAFGHDDAVAPARILAKFAKKHDALVIKSGIVEGRVLPKEEIMAVSSLPGREGMYSMLLCCLKEPVAKVARVVKAVAEAKDGAAPAAEEAVPAAE